MFKRLYSSRVNCPPKQSTNIINRFLLSTVLLPSAMYKRMGVNVSHLKSILHTKLIMDDRRPNTIQQTRPKKDGNITGATLGTMFMSAVMGSFFLISFFAGKDYVTHLTIYFSMYIFLLASSLISDFTSVLIDIRDNYIILPKPVTDRTVVTARLLHIIIHVSKIVLPMSLPGIIYMAFTTNAGGAFVFVIMLIFSSLLTIFLINALYIFILRVTTPQKFQSIISYFQIFFAVFLYASYQIVPRMIDKANLEGYSIVGNKWVWMVPPYWFAAAWQGFSKFDFNAANIAAMVLSIVFPLASIYIVIKYFAPSFNQKLSLINSSNAEQASVSTTGKKAKADTSTYVRTMAKWFSNKGAERMAFLFCWKMTGRSKDFKLKVYPAIGYMIVVSILPFLSKRNFNLNKLRDSDAAPFFYIGFLYFSSFLVMQAIAQMIYSEKFKAAWIYFITPVKAPGQFISGALKAALAKFYIPIVILVSAAAIILAGPKLLPNLLLGLFNEVLICSLITYRTIKELPFSMQQSNDAKSGSFIKGLFMLAIPSVVALLHFLIYKFTPVVYICIVLSAIATWLILGSINNIGWNKILSKANE
jgi:ABC-2 type transport system permease protein